MTTMTTTIHKLLFLIGLIACSLSAYAAKGETLDHIIAIVNDDVITLSEFNRGLALAKTQMSQEGIAPPTTSALNKQVLDQLINKKLQLQLAKQAGISISDDYLNKTIQSIAQQNQISVQDMYARLTQEGMSVAEYRKEMRTQLTLHKLQQQEVASRITISPDEVTSFMRSKMWQSHGAKEYHIEDLLIPVSDSPKPEEIASASQHTQEIYRQLKQGQNFQTIVQAEAKNTPAAQVGDLGFRRLAEIPSAFAGQVAHMQAHDVSQPIQTANGFHIIHVAEVRALNAKQNQQNQKQVEELLLQQKFAEAVQNWVSRMRHQAFVVIHPQDTWQS